MSTAPPRLRTRPDAALLPAVLAWSFVVAVLALAEVPVRDSLAYSGYLLLVIAIPGRLLWRLLRESHPPGPGRPFVTRLEEWACGCAAGYTLELLSYPVARLAGHPRWYVVVPALVIAVLGTREWRRSRATPGVPSPGLTAGTRWGLAGVVGYYAVWLSVLIFSRYRLDPYRLLDEDESFHLALAGELRHHFPGRYPYVEAGDLTYQWFPHAHLAASSWVTGLSPLELYRRFDVMVLGIVAVLGVAALTMHLSRRCWPGLAAAGVLVLVGSFDVSGTFVGQAYAEQRFLDAGVLLNSPTQTMAVALAPAVVLLCLRVVGPGPVTVRTWVGLGLGLAALSGTKVTFVPMLACGFVAAAMIVRFGGRPGARRALAGAALCALVIVVSGAVLYRGDSQSLVWDPGGTAGWYAERLGLGSGSVLGVVLISAALLVGWTLSAAGSAGLLVDRETRGDARAWFLFGAASAGLGATLLLFHGGLSQLYFGRSSAPLLAVLCGWGLARLYPVGTGRGTVLRHGGVAVAAGLVLLGVRTTLEIWNERVDDGSVNATPVLVNAPVVLVLLLLLVTVRFVLRDVSRGRVVLSLRVAVAILVGLGLARSFAFGLGRYPDFDVAAAAKPLGAGALEVTAWLRENSRPEDRVITNAHCVADPPGKHDCDTRHFWMSAFSERRFVLEGWAYTRFGETWFGDFWGEPELLAENDALFLNPSEEALRRFTGRHPARWLLVDRSLDVDEQAMRTSPALSPTFDSGRYAVYEITGAGAPGTP